MNYIKFYGNYLKRDFIVFFTLLLVLFFHSINSVMAEETELPSYPAATSVEKNKSPTALTPIPGEKAKSISDPKSIEAIKALLIQGGIPIPNSQGKVSNATIPPISQYSGGNLSKSDQGSINYLVKKGDTLDGVIRSMLSTHPFKIKKVRQTIINLNRQAFPTGRATSMQAGAILIIPSLSALRAELTGGMAYGVNPFESANSPDKNKAFKDPHEGWVRFP